MPHAQYVPFMIPSYVLGEKYRLSTAILRWMQPLSFIGTFPSNKTNEEQAIGIQNVSLLPPICFALTYITLLLQLQTPQ